ncbi:MAG TPA: formate dehydrogenase subunit gamma [Candidatus Binataceae bacterium]|nr:formate dehydrogenase subunit gamma [Candidatus Binataceae bacterium]
MSGRNSWDRGAVESIARGLKDSPGALMPILRRIQDEYGWVPRESVAVIAEILNLSRAEVHGVVSFYHDFRHEPPGRHVIKVCRAESCQAMGGIALAEHIKQRLKCDFGATSGDAAYTLEAVYCLGNCACSPAVVLDDELLGRVTPERFDRALASREREAR